MQIYPQPASEGKGIIFDPITLAGINTGIIRIPCRITIFQRLKVWRNERRKNKTWRQVAICYKTLFGWTILISMQLNAYNCIRGALNSRRDSVSFCNIRLLQFQFLILIAWGISLVISNSVKIWIIQFDYVKWGYRYRIDESGISIILYF